VSNSRLTIHLQDADATERFGARLGPLLEGGMVVTLQGELGAGKTTVARGLLRSRGIGGPIKSPTYTLVEHYPVSSLYFYHFDFYRLTSPHEWEDAGFADYFRDDAIVLVEWPERVAGLLGPPDLALSLSHVATGGRELSLDARSARGERCLSALAREAAAP
jgi:tRNA threonylcarbamoyladenosine biosynthesis protein TsaE